VACFRALATGGQLDDIRLFDDAGPDDGKPGHVTTLLMRWSAGDAAALSVLVPLVYEELRAKARRLLRRERSDHTLEATALVHEAFLRLGDSAQANWNNREHFLRLAAHVMRRVLVDHARARGAQKRGAGAQRVSFDGLLQDQVSTHDLSTDSRSGAGSAHPPIEVLGISDTDNLEAIDVALTALEAIDARQVKIVELRFFGGLTIEETARVLDLSPATVKREWAFARAWLQRELTQGDAAP
jgi:RNA polymerase sigma factor (sigma-70 family)